MKDDKLLHLWLHPPCLNTSGNWPRQSLATASTAWKSRRLSDMGEQMWDIGECDNIGLHPRSLT